MQQASLTQSCLPQTRPGSAFPSRAKREQLEKLIFLSQRLKTPPANFEGTKPAMIRKSEGLNNSVPISYLGLFRYGGCCRAVCESPKQQVVSLCAYAILASKNGVRVFPHRLYLLVRYKHGVLLSLHFSRGVTRTLSGLFARFVLVPYLATVRRLLTALLRGESVGATYTRHVHDWQSTHGLRNPSDPNQRGSCLASISRPNNNKKTTKRRVKVTQQKSSNLTWEEADI